MTFIVHATGSYFLYDTKKGPASARLMFGDEIKDKYGVSGLSKAWNDLATTRKGLRMASIKRALSVLMVDRVVLSGVFPYSSAAQLVYTDISLYDMLSIVHKGGDLVRILEFETDSVFLMATTVRNILYCALPAIAEAVLEQEAEYYAEIKKDNYILPGDYEEVLSNMENTSKNDILDASKIVAGKITNENSKALMDSLKYTNEDLYKKLQKEPLANARPVGKDAPDPNPEARLVCEREAGSDDKVSPVEEFKAFMKDQYDKHKDRVDAMVDAYNYIANQDDINDAYNDEIKVIKSYSGNDPVNHPQHYKSSSGLEAIDCIEAFTEELPGDLGYCVGNAIKYLCRFNKKGKPVEDLEKARWYADRAIKNVKKREG